MTAAEEPGRCGGEALDAMLETITERRRALEASFELAAQAIYPQVWHALARAREECADLRAQLAALTRENARLAGTDATLELEQVGELGSGRPRRAAHRRPALLGLRGRRP